MINLEDLLKDLKNNDPTLKEMDYKLKTLRITAESGAGLVKVTVNGHKQVINIDIDPALLDPKQKTTLQDLTVAAVNLALKKRDTELIHKANIPNLLKNLI